VLAEGKSRFQSYAFLDTVAFGRILVLDGVIQSADFDEWMYHEAFVIPAMCAVKTPRRVAVLGGGEGAMLREVLRHPSVEAVTMVDIDEEVVNLCKHHLPQQHQGAFDDPRVELVFDDARAWLERQPSDSFDVVLADLTEPLAGGPSAKLFTQEFYRITHRALTDGGALGLQAGSIRLGFCGAYGQVMGTLESVYPRVLPYASWITSFAEQWGFAVATTDGDVDVSPEALDACLAERQIEPRYLDGTAFVGLCHLPRYVRQAIETTSDVATDARPISLER
jgi:spermidine synthase